MKPKHNELIIETRLSKKAIPVFTLILQSGFRVSTTINVSVQELLLNIGIPDDYIRNSISTIFLNGKAVDDVNSAIVTDGSVLTLSSAMPGFVGAAFRKSGFYATMRGAVTYKEEHSVAAAQSGFVVLKLYNFVARDLGVLFMGKGVGVDGKAFLNLLEQKQDLLSEAVRLILVDGEEIRISDLSGLIGQDSEILFKASFIEEFDDGSGN